MEMPANAGKERLDAMKAIARESQGSGIPWDARAWRIVGSSVAVAASVGLWGGGMGGAVFVLLGLAGGFGKLIELSALMKQQSALIDSDIAA